MFRKVIIVLAAALALGTVVAPSDASAYWGRWGWRAPLLGYYPYYRWSYYPYYRPYYRWGYYPYVRRYSYPYYRGYVRPYGGGCWRLGWC